MSSTTIAARTIIHILSSSSSFILSPKPPSLLPTLLLRRPLSILSSTMATLNSNSFAVPFIYTSSSPAHHRLTPRGSATDSAASITSNPTGVWPPPLRVSCIMDEAGRRPRTCTCVRFCKCGGNRHWLAVMFTHGIHFETEEALLDHYVKALANVVGSEEEAKRRMYLVSCGGTCGFGTELRSRDVMRLKLSPGVQLVWPDYCYNERKNDPNFKSATRFTPLNRNRRLENILSYHYLSEPNKKWKGDHWLVIVKQPDVGFNSDDQILNFIVQMLTNVLGSEEEARKRIYVIWYKLPFGFGAEIDKDASNKLREMPDVLNVLPDYAFDVKEICCAADDALEIYPSSPSQKICPLSQGSRYNYFSLIEERGSEEGLGSREEQVGESQDPINCSMNSDLKITNNELRSDCKHWFIAMEKAGDDASMQQQLDGCIQTLADVSKSEKEEAKKRIYRFECGSYFFGVGAKINEDTANKLKGEVQVLEVRPDNLINNCPQDDILFIKGSKEMTMDMRRWALDPVAHSAQTQT